MKLLSHLCNPVDCRLPGSSIYGIFQASVLTGLSFPLSKESSWRRDQTQVSHIAGRRFTVWATRGARMISREIA